VSLNQLAIMKNQSFIKLKMYLKDSTGGQSKNDSLLSLDYIHDSSSNKAIVYIHY